MQMLVEVPKNKAGMYTLIGKVVTFFCCRYIYTGKLVGINDVDIQLEDPSIVYETGKFSDPNWKDTQKLPNKTLFLKHAAIESFGIMK